MAREIKFRCYDKETNTMQQVLMIWLGEEYGLQFTDGNTITLSTTASKKGIELMQYTGKRDDKRTEEYPEGQEIYEKDILGYNGLMYGVVEYDDELAAFVVTYPSVDGKKGKYLLSDIGNGEFGDERVEVIGNIHDTPND